MEARMPRAVARREGERATIEVSGYLSANAAEALEAAFGEVREAARIVVAFAGDCFLNSVGLAILLDAVLPLKEQGREVRIVHPSAHFRRVFQIVGLTQDVPVFASEVEALAGW